VTKLSRVLSSQVKSSQVGVCSHIVLYMYM
jgi:hypothetical protein